MPGPPPSFCVRAAIPPPVLLAPPAIIARRGAVLDPKRSRAEGGEPTGAAVRSPVPPWSLAMRSATPPPVFPRRLLNSIKSGCGGGAPADPRPCILAILSERLIDVRFGACVASAFSFPFFFFSRFVISLSRSLPSWSASSASSISALGISDLDSRLPRPHCGDKTSGEVVM